MICERKLFWHDEYEGWTLPPTNNIPFNPVDSIYDIIIIRIEWVKISFD